MDIIYFWFQNPEIWFKCSLDVDQAITQLFGERVKNATLSTKPDKFQDLENIILLDQLSRHVDRVWKSCYATTYHSRALELSFKVIKEGLEDWLPEHICFILMPLRHSKLREHLEHSLDHICQLRRGSPHNTYYRRFYYANLTRLSKFIQPQEFTCKSDNIPEYKQIFCSSCQYKVDEEKIWLSKLNFQEEIVNSFFKIKCNYPNITISLSGGVDSMVSSFILKKLGFQVTALMINYQNRTESLEEVNLVSSWCQKMEIPFYVTSITQISRTNDQDRNFYETFTKNIRFQSYQSLQNPVVLGHNMDDCFENIFSNIKNKRSIDNLLGMDDVSYQLGATLLRPMLKIRKGTIIEFAQRYNIPYLWDSTPKWSQRGKYRDNLIPSIEKYEPQLLPSLLEMSNRFKKISNHYYQLIEQNLKIDKFRVDRYSIQFMKCTEIDYWKYVFQRCLELYQLKIPSYKSLRHLIFIIESKHDYIGKQVMLTKYYSGHFIEENKLIIRVF